MEPQTVRVVPPGARMSALGLAMMAAAPALMLISALIFGLDVSEEFLFFLTPAVVGALAAYLALRPGVWPRIVTIVVAMMIGMMLFWTAFSITALTSFFDFFPAIMVAPGLVIAISGAVKALRARRTPQAEPDPREAKFIRSVMIVAGSLALISAVLTFATRSTADASRAAASITMKNFEFAPVTVTVTGGESVYLKNSDPFLHTFTIKDLGIDVSFGPGSSKLVTIPAKPGEYVYYCKPHTSEPKDPSDDDMGGRITVS